MGDDPKQGRCRGREASSSSRQGKARGDRETGGSGRSSDDAWDNTTRAEQRTRGQRRALLLRRPPDMPSGQREVLAVADDGAKTTPNPATGKGVLEATLSAASSRTGENPPYGISEGPEEPGSRHLLNGHEAGNGGYSQAGVYGSPRLSSTRHGTKRPLGIPTVRDRVVQAATKIVVEPIFEADFKECSYGFRPKKSATDALEAIRLTGGRGHRHVVEIDIQKFLDRSSHYPRAV